MGKTILFQKEKGGLSMSKKAVLVIILVFLVICDFSVGASLLGEFKKGSTAEASQEVTSTSVCDGMGETSGGEEDVSEASEEIGYGEETDYKEDDYGDDSTSSEEENVFSSGDIIDLIDDEDIVPCISGEVSNLYDPTELDEYSEDDEENNYYKSNYANRYKHLLWCGENPDTEVFYLNKQYSTLTVELGVWEKDKESTNVLTFYTGKGANKKALLKAKLKPGDQEQQYSIDVSDVEYLSVKATAIDSILGASVVTDGIKLTYK